MTKMNLIFIALSFFFFSSCATIIGGSSYKARIVVSNNENAKIYHNGVMVGIGSAMIRVKRSQANKFSFLVGVEGCTKDTFEFKKRVFRGGAFAGTIFGWTGIYQGVPLPWGIVVDFATGAVWKPNIAESGVSKENYKNFVYKVKYTSCNRKP